MLVRDALRRHRADAIRLYLHSHHYRTEFAYEDDGPAQYEPLVRRIEQQEKTAGGIIIPDTAKEKPQEGEVIAAGAGLKAEDGKLTPLDVKAGDRILFGKWSGTEVKLDGQDLLIMKEADIMGVIEGARKKK